MGLLDILQQYASTWPTDREFAEVTRSVPRNVITDRITHAFESDWTRPIDYMVQDMYVCSSPEEQASLLNSVVGTLGVASATRIASGALATILSERPVSITPDQACKLSRVEVGNFVEGARAANPNVVSTLADYYAQRPNLIGHLASSERSTILSAIVGKWPPQ